MFQLLIPGLLPLLDRLPGGKARRGALQLDEVQKVVRSWSEDPNNPGIVHITVGQRDLLANWMGQMADTLDPKGKRHKRGNK